MTTAAPLHPTPAHNLSKNVSPSSPQVQPSTIPRGTVTSTLQFYAAPSDGSPPFNYVESPPADQPQRNFGDDPHAVDIHDLRGAEHVFTLDDNAFQGLSHVPPSAETEFTDDAHIKAVYYPEVERLILDNVAGAHRVLLFDHTIRRSNPDAARAPVTRVHIDQTPASTAARVRHHLPEAEADELLRGRYRIINVWRPLNGPVVSFPLAYADSSTVRDESLVGIQHRYPTRTGETAGVKFDAGQKWYYWSGMKNDERLLLKCADSSESVGQWGRVPHTAFVDPRTPEGAPGRESIEVRALVFG